MDVQTYGASQSGVWDDFVRRSQGTFLHERAYMDYHQDRFPDASVMVYEKGKLAAVLPATAAGTEVSSHGGLTYGGLLHTGLTAAKVLAAFDALNAHYRAAGFETVLYKPVPAIYHPYPADEDLYALFRLDATLVARGIASAVPIDGRKRFTEARRGGLRKAERAGCVVAQSDDLSEFWAALEANLEAKHGAQPVHSLAEMTLLKGRFPEQIRLFEARIDGAFGAGCVVFDTGRVAHAQYITSTHEGRAAGALDALFDGIINGHCEREGTHTFDFGTSTEDGGRTLNEGLIFQKEGFGGRGVVYDTYRYALSETPTASGHAER